MTNHYDQEYTLGYQEAIDGGESIANPHIHQTVDWYAWDCGFRAGQRTLNPDNANLALEAALAAWTDEISRY